MNSIIEIVYFIVAIVFILGLKQLSSPKTARDSIVKAGWAMLAAVLVTFLHPDVHGFSNYLLIVIAVALGSGIAWYSGVSVAMTDMPQMIAVYNGMGGGAAAAIAAVEMLHDRHIPIGLLTIAILGAFIGSISFSGSIIAYAKLQGLLKRSVTLPQQQKVNLILSGLAVLVSLLYLMLPATHALLAILYLLLIALGIVLALPIGGGNMPVVISLFNAMTGLAVGLEGFVLQNSAMIIAGTVVGASGTLLTQLMAKAMNQSLSNILFAPSGTGTTSGASDGVQGTMKAMEPSDAAVMLAYAKKVVIAPGYGMAVAQAQHKVWELVSLLQDRNITVRFAIHPVAGRMPGHMNVLLAEAGVPYDLIADLEEVNPEFANTDVVLVIGANDVVNPMARTDASSPIYGMPILDVDKAHNVLVIKRGQGKGFSGVENGLFFMDNTHMVYGDGQAVVNELVQAVKAF